HAVLKIEPVVGRSLAAGAERNQHRLRHIALGQAELFGAGAVDIYSQVRPVDKLVDVHIDCSGNLCDLRLDLVGDVVPFRVAAGYLNIDRRWNAEIQNLADDVGCGKKEFHVGKITM